MQNLTAVAMGVVAAIALFWSNKPNPAMHAFLAQNAATKIGPETA
jgi:hypothetical protein